MNCTEAIQAISLEGYGELEAAAGESLENHLGSCASCRREWEQHRALGRALDQRRLEPAASLLNECREDLARSLYREAAPGASASALSPWRLFRGALAAVLGPGIRVVNPLGALALLAVGYFAARFTAGPPAGPNLAGMTPDSMISRVRSVQPDRSGRVEIAVDETRQRRISGRFEDPAIQRLLLAAAREEDDPGLRVESVDLLKDHGGSAEIRNALLEAVARDPNPGVRLKALEGLKDLSSDPRIRKTLSQVLLKDDNPGMRIQVIDLLMSQRDESMVGVLQTLVGREENNYVRMRCRKALQEMNASIGTF